jgi:hypothetical protein
MAVILLIHLILRKQNPLHQNDLVLEQQQQHLDNVIQKSIQQQILIYIQIKMVIRPPPSKREICLPYLLKKN